MIKRCTKQVIHSLLQISGIIRHSSADFIPLFERFGQIMLRTLIVAFNQDDLTAPRHLEVTHEGQYSLAIKWDAPECGSIGEYQV
ncbi:unnamed protein product [Strongylus vulgaris]|uniref:Uncharacterized protein n=1 Tax=Strongylus vulgaris TaxID=40348 RepID=A0A3P7J010_STRVU|nr:unnamed protein product [Strongylus vulgaris]